MSKAGPHREEAATEFLNLFGIGEMPQMVHCSPADLVKLPGYDQIKLFAVKKSDNPIFETNGGVQNFTGFKVKSFVNADPAFECVASLSKFTFGPADPENPSGMFAGIDLNIKVTVMLIQREGDLARTSAWEFPELTITEEDFLKSLFFTATPVAISQPDKEEENVG